MSDIATSTDAEITVGEARALLKVSKAKMSALLKQGILPWRQHELDGRIRLVHQADVDRLLAADKRRRTDTETRVSVRE